jgi:hypothetical protein
LRKSDTRKVSIEECPKFFTGSAGQQSAGHGSVFKEKAQAEKPQAEKPQKDMFGPDVG